MLLAQTLSFYKRREIQTLLINAAKNKEVGVRYGDSFGKRPDMLMYESDVLEFAKSKVTSFHCSEELWSNPLNISPEMKRQDLDEQRIGWDLILDIDCHHFAYSKIATHLLIRILKDLGIRSVTCKFSGNKGFHIAVPFESFPATINGQPTKSLFPEAPRRIAYYLKDKLKPLLEKAIMTIEKENISNVVRRTALPYEKLVKYDADGKPTLSVESFLEIDTILIAPRHLYRMPYSLHEKSMLVSVPVDPDKVMKFSKEMAKPENVRAGIPFLDRAKATRGEAGKLIISSYDYKPKELEAEREQREYKLPDEAIPEELFPPCMKGILLGLKDGRKRSLFTLINFLRGAGWTIDAIDEKVHEWNKRNHEPLREVYLKGQLKQARKDREIMPPHNCKEYYIQLGVCNPDSFCARIRNPLQYAKLKAEMNKKKGKAARPRLTEEQKEMRRKFREQKKVMETQAP